MIQSNWRWPLVFLLVFVAEAIVISSVGAQTKNPVSTPAAKQAYAAAAAFQNQGVFELAIEEWEAFLKQFPADPLAAEAQFNLGACYFKLGKFARAADAYAAVAAKYPKFDLAETNLLNLGISHFKAASASGDKQDFDRAAKALDTFIKKYPQSKDVPQALVLRAEAFSAAGKQQEATTSWMELIEKHPNAPQHAEILYNFGIGMLENNQPEQAQKMFARLQREHGDSPLVAVALFEMGEYEYHHRKDYVAAARSYLAAKVKAANPQLAEKIEFKLGWTYYQERDFARSEQVFDALLHNHPQGKLVDDAELMLGECLFKQDKFDAALPHFSKALAGKLSSAHLEALALLRSGQSAAELNKWDSSLKFLDQLIAEQANSGYYDEAVLQRAHVLKSLGRTEDALQQYQIAAEKMASPFAMQAQFMIGRLNADQNNHREAVRSFYKVIHGFGDAKEPSPSQTWKVLATYEAARSFEALQNIEQAKRLYQELIQRYPQSDKVPAAKERLKALPN